MEEFREKMVYQVCTASLVSQDYLVATAVMDATELKAKRDARGALDKGEPGTHGSPGQRGERGERGEPRKPGTLQLSSCIIHTYNTYIHIYV